MAPCTRWFSAFLSLLFFENWKKTFFLGGGEFKNFKFCAFGCTYWGCRCGLKNLNMWPITYFDLIKIAPVEQKLWKIKIWVQSDHIWCLFLEVFSEERFLRFSRFWIFFWKFFENFQFSNMHKTAEWGDWVIKNGELQSFEANKSVLSKILVPKLFPAKWWYGTQRPKKRPFLGHFFEIATNVVFSNIC